MRAKSVKRINQTLIVQRAQLFICAPKKFHIVHTLRAVDATGFRCAHTCQAYCSLFHVLDNAILMQKHSKTHCLKILQNCRVH